MLATASMPVLVSTAVADEAGSTTVAVDEGAGKSDDIELQAAVEVTALDPPKGSIIH